MTADVGFCFTEENLSKAVEIMWQRDCGAVPVIDGEIKVIGIITDRDIAVAAGSRNQKLPEIKISEVIDKKVITCVENDKAEDALKKMRRAKVKRLPVINENGALIGIISITDLILKAPKLKKKILSTFKAIAKPRPIVLKEVTGEELTSDADG